MLELRLSLHSRHHVTSHMILYMCTSPGMFHCGYSLYTFLDNHVTVTTSHVKFSWVGNTNAVLDQAVGHSVECAWDCQWLSLGMVLIATMPDYISTGFLSEWWGHQCCPRNQLRPVPVCPCYPGCAIRRLLLFLKAPPTTTPSIIPENNYKIIWTQTVQKLCGWNETKRPPIFFAPFSIWMCCPFLLIPECVVHDCIIVTSYMFTC